MSRLRLRENLTLDFCYCECYSIYMKEQRELFIYHFQNKEINMALGGYADKVAWVDLTTGKTEYKPIPEDDKLKYVGARGLGVKFVYDNGPKVDASPLITSCAL